MKNHNYCSRLQLFFAAVFTLSVATSANAALVSRLNGQAYYDTDLNITWLANANLAMTNNFGVGIINNAGTMTWNTAQQWIAAMNTADYLGFNNWRLPTIGPVNGVSFNYNTSFNGTTDVGYNNSAPGTLYAGSTASEMAYLFYNELGNKSTFDINGNYPQPGGGLTNTGPFINLQSLDINLQPAKYMSGTSAGIFQMVFSFSDGSQGADSKTTSLDYAWPVLPGDIAAVPVPAAFWLFGSGLIGLFGFTRKITR